jgi:hypothetical protein
MQSSCAPLSVFRGFECLLRAEERRAPSRRRHVSPVSYRPIDARDQAKLLAKRHNSPQAAGKGAGNGRKTPSLRMDARLGGNLLRAAFLSTLEPC